MKHIFLIIGYLLIAFPGFAKCDCKSLQLEDAINYYQYIFAGRIMAVDKHYEVDVYKIWKGDMDIESKFRIRFNECQNTYFPGAFDSAEYVFFMNGDTVTYCSPTKRYYISDVDFLDRKFLNARVNPLFVNELNKAEYERRYIVYTNKKVLLTENKKVIFIEKSRFLNWFYKYKVVKKEKMKLISGFYSTWFYLIDENYKRKSKSYDYVILFENSHLQKIILPKEKRKVLKLIR